MTTSDVAVGARLHAATRPIDAPRELLDHLGEDGFAWFGEDVAFVTAGVAAEVEPAAAADLLRAMQHDAAAGMPSAAGPLAVGALPFSGNGRLVVPVEIVGTTSNGRAWVTTIDGPTPARARRQTPPSGYRVEAVATQHEWASSVEAALREIKAETLLKVVLAREVGVTADTAFDIVGVLAHLRRAQPGCFVFADRGFVGATPELLVRLAGERVTCRPMAGTMPRGSNNDDVVARLLGSRKDSHEHAVVVDAVTSALARWCDDIRATGPEPAGLADVVHLATHIGARVVDSSTSALELACALHPTPAVAGTPSDRAVDLIERLEPTGRGKYAGPVGWVNAGGDGEFAVALRCAQIDGRDARLHAGAGIVAGSDPGAEWEETSAKFEPMLRALVRP